MHLFLGFLIRALEVLHKANVVSKDMLSMWIEEENLESRQPELTEWLNTLPDDEEGPNSSEALNDEENDYDEDDDNKNASQSNKGTVDNDQSDE